uniref:dolichyl-phosphate-mannose--protein mannosyltransferase n=1 Tax=Glossina brevipalpis TaxID=37001 RepID=A0A1A9WKL7_9MUSC
MDYISLGCCTLAFILYLNTLNSGFVYDDRRAILSNMDVSGSTSWQNIFINDFWGTALTDSGSHGSYRPLCVLSYRLNFILSGYSPWGFHLVNNMLHCLATGLVVKVARQLLSSMWGVMVTGALFAVHPIHTETIAGIVGRADAATSICYMLAFLAYLRHMNWRIRNDQRQWLALAFAIVTSIIALLFKETGITALLLCAIFDLICTLCGQYDKNRLRSICVVLSSLVCIVFSRLALIPKPQVSFSSADNPISKTNSAWTRLLTFIYLPVFNFKLLLSPHILSFDWGMDAIPRIISIFDERNILSLTFYSTITYSIWYSYQTLLVNSKYGASKQRSHTSYLVNGCDLGSHYHLQPKVQRKSRTKRKYAERQCQSSEGLYVMNCTNSNMSYSPAKSTTTNFWKKGWLRPYSNGQICTDCKQEINSGQHSTSCRVLNNNNVLTFNAPNVLNSECCCHQFMSSGGSAAPQLFSLALQIIARSSRSSSSCSNSTTASNKSSDSSASSTYSSSSSKSSSSQLSITSPYEEQWTRDREYIFSHTSNSCANACVLITSLAFLILPFLPATNLFFYVGFVVAERLLYLPSVGFCLIIGFGLSKIMDWLRTHRMQRAKQVIIISLCVVLCTLSARTLLRNQDWKNEESLYRSAIKVNPPKALGNLGSVLSSQARYTEAEKILLEAIKYRPNMADVHFNLGILYQNQKKYNFAIESFKNALNFRPNLAVAYLNLGISLIAMGKCQEAAQVLQNGSKLSGTGVRDRNSHENARISSYLQLGALYADQGKLQRALAVYREALHELPHNYHMRDVLYYRIGDIFGRLQKWDEAEKHHRAALNLRPKEAGAHLSYGITLARNSSRASEAEFWFKRALKLAPEQASAYHHYAEFLTSQSRNAEATSYRVRAAKLAPNDYSLVVAAATALRLTDRKMEAEVLYRKAVYLRPYDAHAHTNLGAILHLLGYTSKAAASYKEALRLQPGDITTLSNLAKLGLRNTE